MLRLEHVFLRRGERQLLNDAVFSVEPAQVTVILGPNGAGKSSLLLAMAGLLQPDSGEIRLQGRSMAGLPRMEVSTLVAWQGELPAAEFGLTVRQRLELASGGGDVRSMAERMDIAALLERDLARLSSGERQRVELASVMLRDCPLWLFDEPTAHLDLKHQVRLLQSLSGEAGAGRSVVLVLHDLQQAMEIADKVILLDGSACCEIGEARGLLTPERLSSLFQVKIRSLAEGQMLMPDYRV